MRGERDDPLQMRANPDFKTGGPQGAFDLGTGAANPEAYRLRPLTLRVSLNVNFN